MNAFVFQRKGETWVFFQALIQGWRCAGRLNWSLLSWLFWFLSSVQFVTADEEPSPYIEFHSNTSSQVSSSSIDKLKRFLRVNPNNQLLKFNSGWAIRRNRQTPRCCDVN